jgi:hypothetical protein
MPGPLPKPPGLRSRRNRASTRAVLPTPAQAAEQDVPPLPPKQGKWHERVIVWWERIWRSRTAERFMGAFEALKDSDGSDTQMASVGTPIAMHCRLRQPEVNPSSSTVLASHEQMRNLVIIEQERWSSGYRRRSTGQLIRSQRR